MFQLRPDRRLSSDPEKVMTVPLVSLRPGKVEREVADADGDIDGEHQGSKAEEAKPEPSSFASVQEPEQQPAIQADLPPKLYKQRMAQRRRAHRRALIRRRGKELLQAVRMAKHRCATCQPQHRPKYTAEYERLQEAYAAYKRGPVLGAGLPRASKLAPHGIVWPEGDDKWMPFQRKEKTVWIALDQAIVRDAVTRKRIGKRFEFVSSVSPTGEELCETVGRQLRKRVLQEARFLRWRVTSARELETTALQGSTAIVRRMKALGAERLAYRSGRLHGEVDEYAAFIDFGGQLQRDQTATRGVLDFSAEGLFGSGNGAEEEKGELIKELGEIAAVWNKRIRREKKKQQQQQRNESVQAPDSSKSKNRKAEMLEEGIQKNKEAGEKSRRGERAHVVRRHPWTTDLVASLWRLQKWNESGGADAVEQQPSGAPKAAERREDKDEKRGANEDREGSDGD